MTRGPARRKSVRPARATSLCGLWPLLLALSVASPALAQPPVGATPAWVANRAAWIEARESRRLARWNESTAALAAAERRAAAAESLYRSALRSWTPDASALRVPLAHLRGAALDLLAEGAKSRASLLLEGALRDDEALLPIRASLLGRSGDAARGMALLAWPPDRRLARGDRWHAGFGSPTRGAARDVAHLLTASMLAESLRDGRASRAALWAILAAPGAGPSARERARSELARRFLKEGTPRLAFSVMTDPVSGEQALLLGEVHLSARDTTAAIDALSRFGVKGGLPLSERYPAIRRAAELARSRPDSLAEKSHLELCRALGEVGEADRGLSLLAARRGAPADSAGMAARLETEAGLLVRARRFTDAMASFRTLGALPGLPTLARAKSALGFARAARGARLFAPMDSAFQAAVTFDSTGATGEQAAWERAREWEDQRSAGEVGPIFRWATGYLRTGALRSAARVHGALAWKRAGAADSARSLLASAPGEDYVGAFWRAKLALAAGDSVAARSGFRNTSRLAPASYEGWRSVEELRAFGEIAGREAPGKATIRVTRSRRGDGFGSGSLEVAVLGALGWESIAIERLKQTAREGEPELALDATNALEEAGVFRVGQRALVPEGRLDYPPAYPSEVLRAAAAESVSAGILWAIMRQESAYDRQARSKAGALGLLQLMPATASQLAGRSVPEDSLRDAGLNVRLGARYVRALFAEFGDARAVLASYNAGEEAVRRWSGAGAAIDDEWVERIPYRETRDYVKQVYANWRRYETLYNSSGR